MIRIDSQTLHIKWQIIMKKIKQVHKTMDKTENNICKSALVAGQNTWAGEDLLNECKAWCNKLNIRCVTRGTDPIPGNAKADDFKLKKALWAENDKEIRSELDQKEKVKNIVMPNKKVERNYLANLTLSDARIWFRYRSQILENIKGNRSSNWVDRMHCRHCTTGLRETQKHIEECTFFRKYRETLDLTKGEHKLIFWRRVTRVLKDLKIANKDISITQLAS